MTKLTGVVPILFVPFDESGTIDEASLRRVVRFELEGGVDGPGINGLGINGFASEAYKLSDTERERTVDIVASEVANQVPLVIGIAPGSTEVAIQQARSFARYKPACLMVLPPSVMDNGASSLIKHYRDLADSSDIPLMVQQSPHIPAYKHCLLSAEQLATLATHDTIRYFKIEGPGAPERMAALRPLISDKIGLFGGVGGITFIDELTAGAAGVIPGVGFNEVFVQSWAAWQRGDTNEVKRVLEHYQPLVQAVSGPGHEFSLHARKYLLHRLGIIQSPYVRHPTVNKPDVSEVLEMADRYHLRVSQR
jgi:dihydrodipicolinate synthase/N-acetylneuraminate lyase